jgi:hypothetical protein
LPEQDWIERERAVGYREGHRAALAQRTWVGLTDEEIKRIGKLDLDSNYFGLWYDFAKAIEDYNMALEKDQERPVSPNGSRKIRVRNMNYILEGGGGMNSQ